MRIWRKYLPQTTSGILGAIMLSALIPLLLLQSIIYLFWFRTRSQAEIDANSEFARSVALAFEYYVQDIRRQELIVGKAIREKKTEQFEFANSILSTLKAEIPTTIRFSLVDAKGIIVASSDQRVIGLSVADRSYYREMLSGKEWSISNLVQGPMTDKMNFTISRKTQLHDGSSAIIVAVVDPGKLGGLVLSLERPSEGVFTIFDREGTLVYFGGQGSLNHPNWKASDPILNRALQGREASGNIIYPLDREKHVVARIPIHDIGWVAGAGRPSHVAMAPIYRNLLWVAILNGVILIISLASAIGLSRVLIGRLDHLREFARSIAGGDFSSKSNLNYPVEFAELENAFNKMADQVQARQESLQKAVADLTRSNQELEQFAYVASHDLQEPLRVITGFVQLLEKRYKTHLDKDADRYFEFITDAVFRQQELIRDLLTYSRLGRNDMRMEPVNATVAVQAASQNLRRMIDESHAEITCDQLPVVEADRIQLAQLFQNLIANGIKFKGPEPPVIRISARPENGEWIVAVKDNGIGIEPQYWGQIFTMFKRLHTRKEYPGTGIGLAICKKIIERHGGRIWVDSKPDEGSTFYFTLKAAGE